MIKFVLSILLLVISFSPATHADQLGNEAYKAFGGASVLAAFDARDRNDRARDRNDRVDDRNDRARDRKRNDRYDRRRNDRYKDYRKDRFEHYVKFRIGLRLLQLPLRHTRVVIGPTVYFYSDGVYFIEQNGAYIVAASPIGARIVRLPYGFRSFYIGPRRYFYVNATYYSYAPSTNNYVVIAAPKNAPQNIEAVELVVYPANDQTDEQIDQDRYECHKWALEESSFDPSTSQADSHKQTELYNRSVKACLTGRGYSVQ